MSRQERGEGDFHGNREVNQKPRPLRSNAMTDKDIKKFSQNIGKDFNQLALFLNFEQRQYDMLVRSFQGISEQTFRLVKAWHDVVVDCDENPKELLASALLDIGNKYLAVTYFDEQFANDAEGKEPKQETIEKIQEIDFGAVVNYGASASGSNDVPDSSAGTSGLFKKRDDDTLTQTMVEFFASHMKSVAALIIGGQVVGTAFRVGGMFLMTAFHVVRAIVDPDKKRSYCKRNLTLVKINFNVSPIEPDISNYKLEEWLYFDEPHDVAILKIANPDTRLPPRMFLRKEYVDRSLLNAVQIIGYGHPKCCLKRLDPHCKIVSPNGPEMVQAKEWLETEKGYYKTHLSYQGKDPTLVDRGYKPFDAPFVLLFHCFMEHGASGAPIVRVCQHAANTAASVEVIGVVTCGLPEFFFDLSNILQSGGFPKEKRFEVGSRMSYIFETLEKNRESDSDLVAQLFHLQHPEPLDQRREPMDI